MIVSPAMTLLVIYIGLHLKGLISETVEVRDKGYTVSDWCTHLLNAVWLNSLLKEKNFQWAAK